MYLRAVHAEFDESALQHFVIDNPLGLLISAIQSPSFPTIQCTHIPWVLDVDEKGSSLGTLRGHLARANPHAKALLEACESGSSQLTNEVSVVFNGPAHAYVTPKYYTETKPATGKVVPTWNYSGVQVYGKITIFRDSKDSGTEAFLQKQIVDLTRHAEQNIMGHTGGTQPKAWEVTDAPSKYIDLLRKSIIGIEIKIDRLEGKYKMSQEMGAEDREGVINGFAARGDENASKIAATVKERGEKKEEAARVAQTMR